MGMVEWFYLWFWIIFGGIAIASWISERGQELCWCDKPCKKHRGRFSLVGFMNPTVPTTKENK